jgi:putative toxin-antitoxin system antitoxin component (TIGR02293 family)
MEKFPTSVKTIKVDVTLLKFVATRYGITLIHLARILGISRTTVYRKEGKLSTDVSAHLVQLISLKDNAVKYFGHEENSTAWLTKYNRGLAGKPIDLLTTLEGVHQVNNTLNKLMHGFTA